MGYLGSSLSFCSGGLGLRHFSASHLARGPENSTARIRNTMARVKGSRERSPLRMVRPPPGEGDGLRPVSPTGEGRRPGAGGGALRRAGAAAGGGLRRGAGRRGGRCRGGAPLGALVWRPSPPSPVWAWPWALGSWWAWGWPRALGVAVGFGCSGRFGRLGGFWGGSGLRRGAGAGSGLRLLLPVDLHPVLPLGLAVLGGNGISGIPSRCRRRPGSSGSPGSWLRPPVPPGR